MASEDVVDVMKSTTATRSMLAPSEELGRDLIPVYDIMLLLMAEGPISRDGINDSAPISNAQAEDYLKTLEEHRLLRYAPESRTYSLTRSGRNCARLYAELLKVISTANLAIAGGIPVDENRGVTYAHTPD